MQFLPKLPQISQCTFLIVPLVAIKTILEDKIKEKPLLAYFWIESLNKQNQFVNNIGCVSRLRAQLKRLLQKHLTKLSIDGTSSLF